MFTQDDVLKACKYGSMVCRKDTMHRDGTVSKSFYYRDDISQNGRLDYCIDEQNANKFKFAYFWMNAVAHHQGAKGEAFEANDMMGSVEVLNSIEKMLIDSQGKGVSVNDMQVQLNQKHSSNELTNVIFKQFFGQGKESFDALLGFVGSRNGIKFSNSHCQNGIITFDREMEKEEM